MSFITADSLAFQPRMVISVVGEPYTGKTHFALTAPRPVCLFNLDYGLEGLGFDVEGVEIANYMLDKSASVGGREAASKAKEVHASFMADYADFLSRPVRTTGILDTATEFWQIFRLGDLGKLAQVPPMRYARVNRLYRDLLNRIYPTPHNLVLLHSMTDEYESKWVTVDGEAKEVSSKTGRRLRDGFKHIESIVQVEIHTYRKEKKSGKTTFGFKVAKCRQRPSVTGQVFEGPMADFGILGQEVFPESGAEDWE